MDTQRLISSTACAAFVTDSDGQIVDWNEGAEELLGLAGDDAVGRTCHEVLDGRDIFGNRFCDGSCTVHNMSRRGEPVRHFQMDVRKSSGDRIRVGLCTLVMNNGAKTDYRIIHMLQPAVRPEEKEAQAVSAEVGAGRKGQAAGSPAILLTAREMDVLRLLMEGISTQTIADQLRISVTTVRNHIQGILRKLGAHSRLEAVSVARRLEII